MNSFRLQDPLWLLALLPVAGALLLSVRRSRPTVLFSSLDGLRDLPPSLAQRLKRMLPVLRFSGIALLVVALARPQEGRAEFRVRTEGIAIMMVIDRSGSMEALDFERDGVPVNRLRVVKDVFREFVAGSDDLRGRPDDRIGLVAFGGFAESLCPLTLDHGALLEILGTVEIPQPIRDRQGRILEKDFWDEERATAIGDALAVGVDRLASLGEAESKILILLSDGANTAGIIEPSQAAEAAHAVGVKVYTVGVGSDGPVPVPVPDRFGRQVLRTAEFELDEELLQKIAEDTGGQYFNARDTAALREVYATIDELEKTETEGLLYTEYRERYGGALLAGLGLLILDLVLRSTRFSTLP